MTSDAENWGASDEFEEAWGQYVKIQKSKNIIQNALDHADDLLKNGNRDAAEKELGAARAAIETLMERCSALPEKEREPVIRYAKGKEGEYADRWESATGKLPDPIEAVEDAGAPEQASAPQPEHAAADTPEPSKIRVKKDFVQDVVTRICGYESPDGKSIDRWSMPGGADDLLWLMEKLYPDEFADMSIKAFRAHYKRICRWPTTASSQAGARPIYLEIFPELKRNPAPVIQIRN